MNTAAAHENTQRAFCTVVCLSLWVCFGRNKISAPQALPSKLQQGKVMKAKGWKEENESQDIEIKYDYENESQDIEIQM